MQEVKQEVSEVIDAYFEMWNEDDATRRDSIIARLWTPDGSYTDPLLEASGTTALSQMIGAVQDKYPDHRFTRTSGIDVHHTSARYAWELAGPDGSVLVGGVDIADITDDGRLERVTGFFGPIPELGA
ncbi:MAG TPA: nuclear transport factor 2 family protein [Dehalococcoidia bacterium]|jgi:hypothetical protein|nr:nuclear transport factor 2 family protein [Dehalococcoidia bacterium]